MEKKNEGEGKKKGGVGRRKEKSRCVTANGAMQGERGGEKKREGREGRKKRKNMYNGGRRR